MAKLSKVDWDIIDARVRAAKAEHGLPTSSMALLLLVLRQFFPAAGDDLLESITDGPGDRGVDALQIVEGNDSAEVFVFQAKYRESLGTTEKTINDSEALKIRLFLQELFEKSGNLADVGNLRLREAAIRIWGLHERGIICRYHVVFCSNDQGLSVSAHAILKSLCESHQQVSYECYGAADLIRDLGSRERRRETGALHVVGREVFERADGDIRGIIASIDARSFIDLIRTGDGTVKRYLFDDNLRIFLGVNGGYNSSIIATATSPDRHLFWYLNNGITITCRTYSYNKGHSNPKIIVEDFQIVNGAQTSHSLLEAHRIDPEALSDVVLTARIYATDRSDIIERVAVATNSQARIQSRDLRANTAVLKKLELGFLERGYYFERKRNMHADREAARRIDALKLGQIILAFYLREPDRAKGESDSIFDYRFSTIFHESYDIDELCRLFEFYRLIEVMREAYLFNNEGSLETGSDLQYLVYGHWFILYAAKLLLGLRNAAVPSGEAAQKLANEAIALVARACTQNKAVAHYQMFRSPKTKDKILAELSGKQGTLFDLLAAE